MDGVGHAAEREQKFCYVCVVAEAIRNRFAVGVSESMSRANFHLLSYAENLLKTGRCYFFDETAPKITKLVQFHQG